jgi:hypothetical protein
LLTGAARRWGLATALLLAAASLTQWLPVRVLLAPLLLASHPQNFFWGPLAVVPGAIAGAAALQALADRRELPRGPALLAGGLLFAAGARALLPWLPTGAERVGAAASAGQGALVLAAATWLLRSGRTRWLLVLGCLDLLVLGARMHQALPSTALDLRGRAVAALPPDALDITHLADLQGFLYARGELEPPDREVPADVAARVSRRLLDRRWALHGAAGAGTRAIAGTSKVPPERAIGTLMPLADALTVDGEGGPPLEDFAPHRLPAVFDGPTSIGRRVMQLHGASVALGRWGEVAREPHPAPPCWSPASVEVVPELRAAAERAVARGWSTTASAVLEAPPPGPLRPARVRCEEGGAAVVADAPGLVVVRRRLDSGWRWFVDGQPTAAVPVDVVHTGVFVPAGEHTVAGRYRPPGLRGAQLAGVLGWLGLLGLGWARRAERASGAAEPLVPAPSGAVERAPAAGLPASSPGSPAFARAALAASRWHFAALPAVVALVVAAPLLVRPEAIVHADAYRAFDWLEAGKWRWYVRDVWLSGGGLAAWNPYLEGGSVGLAHPSDGSLSPTFALHLLLGVGYALKVEAALLLAAGAAGVAVLALTWLRLDGRSSAVAGLLFAVCAWVPSRVAVGFYESLWLCVFPWVLAGVVAGARGHRRAPLLAAALLAVAGVQMQLCLVFAALQLALVGALDRDLGPRRLLPVVAAVLAGVAVLGAVKFAPMVELLAERSFRVQRPQQAASLLGGVTGSWFELFAAADPVGAYGPDGASLRGEYDAVGLPLLGGVLGIAGFRRHPRGALLAGLLLVTLGLGWQPGRGLQLSLFSLLRPLPIFDAMRDTSRYVAYFAALWLCLAGGAGWSTLPTRVRRGLLVLLVPPALASASLSAGVFAYRNAPPPSTERFVQVGFTEAPSAGIDQVRLAVWHLPQAGYGVQYRAEDLPDRPPAGLEPAHRITPEGAWVGNPAYRGEAWVVEGAGRVGDLVPGPDRLELPVQASAGTLVAIAQRFHRDWRVESPPGAQLEPHAGLLAVRVPAGEAPVVLTFRSTALRWGGVVTIGGWLVLGLLAWRWRPRTAAPSP